jgi:hypothetical protein
MNTSRNTITNTAHQFNQRTIGNRLDDGNDTVVFKSGLDSENNPKQVTKLWQGGQIINQFTPAETFQMAQWYKNLTNEASSKLESLENKDQHYSYLRDYDKGWLETVGYYIKPENISIRIPQIQSIKTTREDGQIKNIFSTSKFVPGQRLFEVDFPPSETWKKEYYTDLIQEVVYPNILGIQNKSQLDKYNLKYNKKEDGTEELIITDILGRVTEAYELERLIKLNNLK